MDPNNPMDNQQGQADQPQPIYDSSQMPVSDQGTTQVMDQGTPQGMPSYGGVVSQVPQEGTTEAPSQPTTSEFSQPVQEEESGVAYQDSQGVPEQVNPVDPSVQYTSPSSTVPNMGEDDNPLGGTGGDNNPPQAI